MTEHHEKLVRQWRKEGIPMHLVMMFFLLAELHGKDPTQIKTMFDKYDKDLKATIYGIRHEG